VLIDWFTVVAQIINFLILVGLLKHFLYDRIIRAMEERDGRIRARLEEAEKKEKESDAEAEKYRQKNIEIEEKRKEMLEKAREEAENRRKELTQKARQEVENLRMRWQESVRREKTSFLRELKQMAGHQVYAVTRRAIKDLADEDLEERAVYVFLDKLQKMKREEKNKLAEAFKKNGNKATVRSGFELSESQHQQITRTLHEQIDDDTEVRYETDTEIIFGIELKSGGKKLAWSLEGYIKALEDQTRAALEKEAVAEETEKEYKEIADREEIGKDEPRE
jgi:F-type H+-transporting ATPase subunit b